MSQSIIKLTKIIQLAQQKLIGISDCYKKISEQQPINLFCYIRGTEAITLYLLAQKVENDLSITQYKAKQFVEPSYRFCH